MKRLLVAFAFLFVAGFSWVSYTSEEVLESPINQVQSEKTDRMIVKVIDEAGNEKTESVTLEELEKSKEGHLKDESSALYGVAGVEEMEPDYIRSAGPFTDSVKSVSWGTGRIGAKEMALKITEDKDNKDNVIIAVIDTGVDYTHSHLKNRIVKGYDMVANKADPMDVHYHGTHVAGIIADSTPANVKIMPIRALNKEGKGYDSDVSKSIRYAVNNGAHIINMSLGAEQYSDHLEAAIDYALSKNVVVIVAAGNNGGNTANYYPASAKNVIVVSAIDKLDKIAKFSNTGKAVDLSAPGVGIVSSLPGERYGSMDGTSMATPYASAIAAMLKLDDRLRTPKEIERLLKKYVDDRGAVGWDPLYGEGILNVTKFDEGPIVKNNKPVVNKEKKLFTVGKDELITVDLSRYVVDADGDSLTYTADKGKLTGSKWVFSTPMIGEHTIKVKVTDGKSDPVHFELKIIVDGSEEVEEPVVPTPSKFILLPEPVAALLDTEWSVKFDRQLTERNVVDIRLYEDKIEVPITLVSNIEEKEIIASPTTPYKPETTYRLVILVEKGKSYEMYFKTVAE